MGQGGGGQGAGRGLGGGGGKGGGGLVGRLLARRQASQGGGEGNTREFLQNRVARLEKLLEAAYADLEALDESASLETEHTAGDGETGAEQVDTGSGEITASFEAEKTEGDGGRHGDEAVTGSGEITAPAPTEPAARATPKKKGQK